MLDQIDSNTALVAFISFGIILASFITFYWNKKWGIRLLIIGSALLGYFMASLDPFLNLWDEQQHALVAKNMAENPFYPTLYKEALLPYDFKYWIGNHIWIHKQPLFLWQMALSIKIFGANVLAVRLPSIVLHAILPYLIYRIGSAVRNETTGFIAAIFITCANFPLELVAGRYATDHNDMSFLFYISWSVLCWVQYQKTKDKKWLIWLGVSAGCAVLVKWLMGLLVYVCWFLVITIQQKFKIWNVKSYFVMIKPFLISLLIFLPWQIYCFIRFPVEAAYEMKMSASHFSNVIEGHAGDWTYHIDHAWHFLYFQDSYLFGDWTPLLVLVMVGIGVWQLKNNTFRLFFIIFIVFVYLFFSMAATKMLGFTLIAMPLVLLGLSSTFVWLKEIWSKYLKVKLLNYILLGTLIFSPVTAMLKLDYIQQKHSMEDWIENDGRYYEFKELELIDKLKNIYGEQDLAVFNSSVTVAGAIQIMFFTDYVAYSNIPDDDQIKMLRSKGYKVVVLDRNDLTDEMKVRQDIDIVTVP